MDAARASIYRGGHRQQNTDCLAGHELRSAEEVEQAMKAKKQAVAERKACKTFGELVALARRTGKNLYWATKVWQGRQR